MKTYKHLFDTFVSFDNLLKAYNEARKHKKNIGEVLRYGENLEQNLLHLQQQLRTKQWEPSPYRMFVSIREVKRRVINAPTFEDRIVHHALANVIRSLCERQYIADTYASIKGRGTHRAGERVHQFLRRDYKYVLQCDISKFYASIDKEILFNRIKRIIADKDILEIIHKIIFKYDGNGIPIGSLCSQIFANVYLSELDHIIKEKLQCHCYCRYMDDFVLFDNSKATLKEWLCQIKEILARYRVTLNPKTKIYKVTQGVDFVGYRHFKNYTLPRKRVVKAAKVRLRHCAWLLRHDMVKDVFLIRRIASFVGYMSHCNGSKTMINILNNLNLSKGREQNVLRYYTV